MEDAFGDEAAKKKEEMNIQIHEHTQENHWKSEQRPPDYDKAEKCLGHFGKYEEMRKAS
jgi:hypothetical protein